MVCRVCEKFKTCDSPYCGDSSMVQCGYYEKAKQTNADHIRSMTDEELAEMITSMLSERDKIMLKKLYDFGINATLVENVSGSFEQHLNWLKQESDETNEQTN